MSAKKLCVVPYVYPVVLWPNFPKTKIFKQLVQQAKFYARQLNIGSCLLGKLVFIRFNPYAAGG